MNEVQTFMFRREIQPSFSDLFSYSSRAKKRLLRNLYELSDTVAENDLLGAEGKTLEIWLACMATVWQGYWYSRVREGTKKTVLDKFHLSIMNVLINDLLIPTRQFQEVSGSAQNQLIDESSRIFARMFESRAEEYVRVIIDLINKADSRPIPFSLADTVAKNCLERTLTDVERMSVAIGVALPMLVAFSRARKG